MAWPNTHTLLNHLPLNVNMGREIGAFNNPGTENP